MSDAADEGFIRQDNLNMVITENDPERLIQKMKDFIPVSVRKWIDIDEI